MESAQKVEPQKPRGKSLLFVGAAVLILIVAVVGVGGFLAWNWMKTKPDGTGGRDRKKELE